MHTLTETRTFLQTDIKKEISNSELHSSRSSEPKWIYLSSCPATFITSPDKSGRKLSHLWADFYPQYLKKNPPMGCISVNV